MRIKKFFEQTVNQTKNENETVPGSDNLDFNSKSEFFGPSA
jgi:hypothetical protein